MVKIKNYEFLLNKKIFKDFNKKEVKEKLNIIFNSKNSKIDWGNVPIYIAK